MPDDHPRLGFIGIGLMGAPMSARLLEAGYALTIWNRSRDKMAPLLDLGAAAADDPAGVAGAADFVFTCLTDGAAVEAVVFGPGGVAEAAGADKLLVDFSSMAPGAARDFAKRLGDGTGMGWIDAPVSGGVDGAVKGTLAILAGGAEADILRVAPVFAHLGQRTTHMGPIGAGQVTKLCNQVIAGCTMAVLAEAIRLAEISGVDAARLPEAFAGGFADSQPMRIFGPRFAARQTEPLLGHVNTMLKDVDAALALAEAGGAALPMTAAAAELLRLTAARGHGEEDIGMIMDLFGPVD